MRSHVLGGGAVAEVILGFFWGGGVRTVLTWYVTGVWVVSTVQSPDFLATATPTEPATPELPPPQPNINININTSGKMWSTPELV